MGRGGAGPIAAARTRARIFPAGRGALEPMIGLLAGPLDDLDDASWAALRVLAAHPGGARLPGRLL